MMLRVGTVIKVPVHKAGGKIKGYVVIEVHKKNEEVLGRTTYMINTLGSNLPTPALWMLCDRYHATDMFNEFGDQTIEYEELPLMAGWPWLTRRYRELLEEGFSCEHACT